MSLPQTQLLSIGEKISSLKNLPKIPEENWRRTDPEQFFLPADELINNFGQSVLGSHLGSSPYKVQFRSLSAEDMQRGFTRLTRIQLDEGSFQENLPSDVSKMVLVSVNNGAIVVSSCSEADSWVGRLEIASRPSRPESIFRDSAISTALAERLQVCAPSELVVRIPRFEHVPVVLVGLETEPAFEQSYANVTIDVADGAEAEVAVVHGSASFVHHRVTFRLGRDARVTQLWTHLGSTDLTDGCVLLERKVKLAARSQFYDSSVFVPSSVLRVLSNVTPEAEGSAAYCGSSIIASGHAVVDYEPLQDHLSPKCQSHLRAKMIAGQRGKAIFQGLINVEREGTGTNSSQINKNLVLSKRSRIDSMPRLRILPDEVSCKHGSATGELDSKQIHYLMTRGFTEHDARELVVRGFVLEGLSQLPEQSPLLNWASLVVDAGLERVLR